MPIRIKKKCLNCGAIRKAHRSAVQFVYCSNKCHHEHKFKLRYDKWINGGSIWSTRGGLKRAVIQRDGYKCNECSIDSWNGKEISLELEHIDGNYQNCLSVNVCLLCPNCHSQTPTFKAKNWGNGRKGRHSTLIRKEFKVK